MWYGEVRDGNEGAVCRHTNSIFPFSPKSETLTTHQSRAPSHSSRKSFHGLATGLGRGGEEGGGRRGWFVGGDAFEGIFKKFFFFWIYIYRTTPYPPPHPRRK